MYRITPVLALALLFACDGGGPDRDNVSYDVLHRRLLKATGQITEQLANIRTPEQAKSGSKKLNRMIGHVVQVKEQMDKAESEMSADERKEQVDARASRTERATKSFRKQIARITAKPTLKEALATQLARLEKVY